MDSLASTTLDAFSLLLSGDTEIWTIIGISFQISTTAILIAMVPAVSLGFLLAYYSFPGRRFLVALFNTLLAVPAVVIGLTLYIILSRQGPLGEWRLLFTQFIIMREVRFALLGAFLAAYGRIIAEVGASMMLGGNILHYTRNIPTAIALETSKGEFAQGIALGIILIIMAFFLTMSLHIMQGKGSVIHD